MNYISDTQSIHINVEYIILILMFNFSETYQKRKLNNFSGIQ